MALYMCRAKLGTHVGALTCSTRGIIPKAFFPSGFKSKPYQFCPQLDFKLPDPNQHPPVRLWQLKIQNQTNLKPSPVRAKLRWLRGCELTRYDLSVLKWEKRWALEANQNAVSWALKQLRVTKKWEKVMAEELLGSKANLAEIPAVG